MSFILSWTAIITYQEKSGNYNLATQAYDCVDIITYQEKSGNYNFIWKNGSKSIIITYQEKSGNYNCEYQFFYLS